FLIPEQPDAAGDVFLPTREMRKVLHEDRVVVRVSGYDRRGRREGAVVEVLEHANTQIVGRFFTEGGIGFVVPDNRRINQDVLIPAGDQGTARHGQFVVAEIVRQPTEHTQPVGRVVEVLG